MHTPSARFAPDSPPGHHWHDATHIAFGVATLGVASGPVKVDASLFTGAEPDEERFGFDAPTFDSYAARVTYSPTPRLTLHAAPHLKISARLPPALELPDGTVLRFSSKRLTLDSAYFAAAPTATVAGHRGHMGGTLRASVCDEGALVCRRVQVEI
jgi:hypothetical protein